MNRYINNWLGWFRDQPSNTGFNASEGLSLLLDP